MGEYRFVAEAMSHVVFADPANDDARRLGADALEQLGYAAESATWRNAYLLGARELRQGSPTALARTAISPDVVRALSPDLFFDYLAVRINSERAEGQRIVLNWVFFDLGRHYVSNLENCALAIWCRCFKPHDVPEQLPTTRRGGHRPMRMDLRIAGLTTMMYAMATNVVAPPRICARSDGRTRWLWLPSAAVT